jgi:hypothetical protein
VGLRFAYSPAPSNGVATLGANTFAGTQTAPAFVGDGSGVANVNAAFLNGLSSAAFAPTGHGHDVMQVSNAARIAGGNSFSGSQTITAGSLTLDNSSPNAGNIFKGNALFMHNGGSFNTFLGELSGVGALASAGASQNTGLGHHALLSISTGPANTAVGVAAGRELRSGLGNTAVGASALYNTTSGDVNTALGVTALQFNTTGQRNVAVGGNAGYNATTGDYNIYVGADVLGQAGESHTMYLGRVGTQTKTFIAGVRGITTMNPNAVSVMIDSAGQLGTVSSSRRFKEDIYDMGDASEGIFQLRPVTFRYAQAFAGSAKPLQYGLIAEEVAVAFPALAVVNADGQPETVKYQDLSVLLLNELQKQRRRIEALERQLRELRPQQGSER